MAKKSNSKNIFSAERFAPAGLWLSGVAAVSALFGLVFKLLSFIGLYKVIQDKTLNLWIWISLAAILLGLSIYALLAPHKVRNFLAGRQARHGSNAVIMLIAFILILVVVNAIVYQNPKSWDWTEDKNNSLAPETIEALKALPEPVHAIGFFTSRISSSDAETLLIGAKANSNGKFSYEFVDPTENPVLANQYKITQDGTIVLVMNDHHELFTSSSEQDFTNSLVRLMNPGDRTVYFLTGHGEHNTQTTGEKAYTRARTVLESKNYVVKTLNLLAQNQIPEDALAIIISGPTQPITTAELTLLEDYVSKGGSLIVLEDPILTSSTENTTDPLKGYLAATWDIKINNDLVIDPSSNQVLVAVENTYGSHAITKSMESQNLVAFFPTASSISLTTNNQNVHTTFLVKTIDRAWGETNMDAFQNKQVAFDANSDQAGPLIIAATASTVDGTGGRIVVFGDSDFASDGYFDQYGNSDMFINSVDWAAGQEAMISLTTKQTVARQMAPLDSLTVLILALAFVILIPGLIVAGGVASWWLRRSRG
jgi:ABC-type uncharacterized transport system involved in gliding motility auxiliary subunit